MRRKLCWIGLAATLVLGLVPAAASAENYHYQFRGNSAHASFWDIDSTGCITTYAAVSLYANRFQQPPGRPQEESALDVYISRYDSCQNQSLFYGGGWATLSREDFDTSNSLQTASVTVTVDIYDWFSGTQTPVSIDLDWTGVGDTSHGTSRSQYSYANYRSISRWTGSSREAEVTGTILLGTTNLATGSFWASLHSGQSGYLSIWR